MQGHKVTRGGHWSLEPQCTLGGCRFCGGLLPCTGMGEKINFQETLGHKEEWEGIFTVLPRKFLACLAPGGARERTNAECAWPTGRRARRDLIQRFSQHDIGHISSTCIIVTEDLERSLTIRSHQCSLETSEKNEGAPSAMDTYNWTHYWHCWQRLIHWEQDIKYTQFILHLYQTCIAPYQLYVISTELSPYMTTHLYPGPMPLASVKSTIDLNCMQIHQDCH